MADTKWSSFPSATPGNSDEVVGLHSGGNARFSIANIVAAVRNGLANIFVPKTDVGAAGGVASLDSTGKVPTSQLPPISSDADDITYDPTTSGATATNVQDALDEAFSDLDGKQNKITASGILKGDGAGGVSAAVAGTDYQAPLTAGTDYATPAQLADKSNQSQLAYVETGATASRNYTAGQYISLNGLLYTADTAIASGATFYTSGGNKNLTECVGGGFNSIPRIEQSHETTGITTASNCVLGPGGYTRIGKILLLSLYVWVTSGSNSTALYLNLSDDIKPSSNAPISILAQNVSDDSTVNVYAVASGNAVYMKGTTSSKGFALTGWWLTN